MPGGEVASPPRSYPATPEPPLSDLDLVRVGSTPPRPPADPRPPRPTSRVLAPACIAPRRPAAALDPGRVPRPGACQQPGRQDRAISVPYGAVAYGS